ncbi:replication initiation protein [Alteromonas sp. ASW11-19]|uniref:Replication initiation protein n=1 Tax=Alteromonas salexigens TaxID=2982530 RepID=A0ABT2VQZ3_9ALTE|nr:replication initiation protein [Alteromonas salexigens]MCU7554666.1 replication initiation protein [Alteromonas salexigens]
MTAARRIDDYAEEIGYSDPKSNLNRILKKAPYYPRCSNNKTSVDQKPAEYAVRQPYMQVNRADMVSWLVFDIDDPNAARAREIFPQFYWEAAGLPEPNIVVSKKPRPDEKQTVGGCHLFYAIVPVCTSEKARKHPQDYMRSVYKAMGQRIGNDPAFTPFGKRVVKTPGHPEWRTWDIHDHVYELGELADSIELECTNYFTETKLVDYSNDASRHCLLFDEVRRYAYNIVKDFRKNSTLPNFEAELLVYAKEKNTFGERGFNANLTISQVKATVKSISTWTWNKYTGSGRVRGVMNLFSRSDLSTREKRRLSSLRTAEIRSSSSAEKVRHAAERLLKKGARLSLVDIAKNAGLSRQTVAKYKTSINQAANSNIIPLKSLFRKTVKFGAHQIPSLRLSTEDTVVKSITTNESPDGSLSLGHTKANHEGNNYLYWCCD